MATIRKHRNKWQAQIRRRGVKPISRSFPKISQATAWAQITEAEIFKGTYVDPRPAESVLLQDLIERFIKGLDKNDPHRSPKVSRCRRLGASLGRVSLALLKTSDLADYRDRRLKEAAPMTVIHELSLLHRILSKATSDWGYSLPRGIPGVSLPKRPQGRIRRLEQDEESRLLAALEGAPIYRDLVIVALETAMRRGELVSIEWKDIDSEKSVLRISKTKTGVARAIPLSHAAFEVLSGKHHKNEKVFPVTALSVTRVFREACEQAGIHGLNFHDLRHEATSRLFECGLNVIEVASITGHKSLEMLNRYTHLRAEDLVGLLDQKDR